jgi:5-formyltetrahydrofolate cyclo-ligase
MTEADVPSEKRQLRRLMRERLVGVSSVERLRAGEAVAEVLTRARIWSASSSLAAFASKLDEIDCSPLVERALSAGKPVRLPRTTDSGSLEFVAIRHVSQLRTGRFGLMEPGADMLAVSLAGDALVVVPGLAFDRLGGRLGRGRGYYDRALAALRHRDPRPLLIGIGYAFQIIDHVPMTRLDARLDGIVSEEGLCECEASRGRWADFGQGTGRSDER